MYFIPSDIPEAMEGGFNRTEFQTMLYERLLIIWKDSLTEKQTQDAYWATDFFYTPWPYIEDEGLNRKAFVDVSRVKFRTYRLKGTRACIGKDSYS